MRIQSSRGASELYVNAKRIRNSVTEDGGMLELIYTVETYGADAQFNHLKGENNAASATGKPKGADDLPR